MSENSGPYKGEGETVYATAPERDFDLEASREEYDEPYHDPEMLNYHYHVLRKSQRQIAEYFDVTCGTIKYWMNKNDIEKRDRAKAVSLAHGGHQLLWDEDWLREQYVNNEIPVTKIAEKLDVGVSAVMNAMERAGIEVRDHSESIKLAHNRIHGDRKYNDPKWLYHEYWRRCKSMGQIAEEHGWSAAAIERALNKHDIQTRSLKASKLLQYKKEKCVPLSNERDYEMDELKLDVSWRDLKDVERGCVVPYRDKKWLSNRVADGLSNREIADICDCDVHRETIRKWRQKFGIERKS